MMHLTIFSTVSSFFSSSSEKRQRGTEGWDSGTPLTHPFQGAAASAEWLEKPRVPCHTRKPLGNTRSLILEKKGLRQQLPLQGEGLVLLLQNRGASGGMSGKQVPKSGKRRVLAQPWSPWLQGAGSAQGSKGKQKTNPLGPAKHRNGGHTMTERAPELHTVKSLKHFSEEPWLVPALLWNSSPVVTSTCSQALLEAGGLGGWMDGSPAWSAE